MARAHGAASGGMSHVGMRMTGQLMEISRDGVLEVNYSDRLVQLLRVPAASLPRY